jgi:hypothetical protein
MRQLVLVRREDHQRSVLPPVDFDEETIAEVVSLMAQAILVVLQIETENDDER